jgi:hypothetical protein
MSSKRKATLSPARERIKATPKRAKVNEATDSDVEDDDSSPISTGKRVGRSSTA